MLHDGISADLPDPGEIREQRLARQRTLALREVRRLLALFFASQGIVGVLTCAGILFAPDSASQVDAVLTFLAPMAVSIPFAVAPGVVALRHAALLSWKMLALGVAPWIVIATESTLVVVCVVVWF